MTKRKSNKKRKIEYIREKNHYRSGGEGGYSMKVSEELKEDEDYIKWLIQLWDEDLIKIGKKYKMNFERTKFDIGKDHEDFMRQTFSIVIRFKRTC